MAVHMQCDARMITYFNDITTPRIIVTPPALLAYLREIKLKGFMDNAIVNMYSHAMKSSSLVV